MKKIGLVGGMTPESTVAYYQMIIGLGRERWDNPLCNPEVLIFSINLAEVATSQNMGDDDRVVAILVDALERLRGAGAEVAGLTANTPHVYFDRIQKGTPLPLVHMIDATYARSKELGVRRALLLGTDATMQSPMYPDTFAAGGIEVVTPEPGDRVFVNRSIYEELAVGNVTPEMRETYLRICKRQIEENGIDTVILGCTELPLVLQDGDLPVQLVDSARCHAQAIFERSLD